jgi:hypothetical protein
MADLVFNVSLHELPRATWQSGPLDVRSLLLSSAETDEALRDHEDIAALLAGSSVEVVTMTSYARITHTSETLAIDNGNNWVNFGADDAAFGVVGNGANETTSDIIVLDWGGTDATSEPVSLHDAVFLSDGSSVTIQWASGVMWRAAG